MTSPSPHIALYGSRQQEGHVSAIRDLVVKLKERGFRISVERKLADVLHKAGYRPAVYGIKSVSTPPSDISMAISVGGDGTFLRTARWLDGKEVPVLGINTGHLGFLAENSTDNIDSVVELIVSGDYKIERRLMLQVEIPVTEGALSGKFYALNEVAFMKGAASMVDIHVKLDGLELATYKADGLLVTTPTGSTAYNLSVGGPILAPTLQSVVLSPVAPHTLTLRPVVVSADSVIEATVSSRAPEFRLTIDGKSISLPCGTVIKIRKAPHSTLTVRRPGENFATTLRSKLLWGH